MSADLPLTEGLLADTFDGDGGDTLNEHEKSVVFDGAVGGERG